jgi:hypothetical protein
MKISVIENNEKYFVPVKYLFETNKLDFDSAMLYFNTFRFEIERFYLQHENEEYMCFELLDFIKFMIIVSVLNTKIDNYARMLVSKLGKNDFKIMNKANVDLIAILDKYIRKPEQGEKPDFVMVKNLVSIMHKSDLAMFNNEQIIGRILKMKYKRVSKRTGNDVRYGYEVIIIAQK